MIWRRCRAWATRWLASIWLWKQRLYGSMRTQRLGTLCRSCTCSSTLLRRLTVLRNTGATEVRLWVGSWRVSFGEGVAKTILAPMQPPVCRNGSRRTHSRPSLCEEMNCLACARPHLIQYACEELNCLACTRPPPHKSRSKAARFGSADLTFSSSAVLELPAKMRQLHFGSAVLELPLPFSSCQRQNGASWSLREGGANDPGLHGPPSFATASQTASNVRLVFLPLCCSLILFSGVRSSRRAWQATISSAVTG